MQKSTRVLLYALSGAIIVSAVGLSSCSKDDKDPEPEVKPQLSFAETEVTVNEEEGSVEVELVLDKAAEEDVVITYELGGTAQDAETATTETDGADYLIDEDYLEIEIPEGETTATIHIDFIPDFLIENPETIVISIDDVDSDKIEITRDDEVEITLEQEQNGIIVGLTWDETYTDVDMDMFLRLAPLGQDVTTRNVAWASVSESTDPEDGAEAIFIPRSIGNALFGMSYTYYAGTEEPMNFTSVFIDVEDGQLEPVDDRTTYEGSYNLVNIFAWTGATINNTKVVQKFEVVEGEFKNYTEITAPGTGSRVDTHNDVAPVLTPVPPTIRKGNASNSLQKLSSILQRKHL